MQIRGNVTTQTDGTGSHGRALNTVVHGGEGYTLFDFLTGGHVVFAGEADAAKGAVAAITAGTRRTLTTARRRTGTIIMAVRPRTGTTAKISQVTPNALAGDVAATNLPDVEVEDVVNKTVNDAVL